MSPDNMYLRFFSLSPRSGEQEAQRVCRDPGPDHVALLAWLGGRLVGVASYEATGRPGEAEVAFVVPDDMYRCGIAILLLEHLAALARQRRPTRATCSPRSWPAAACADYAAEHGRSPRLPGPPRSPAGSRARPRGRCGYPRARIACGRLHATTRAAL
jgi:hypothetical protein